jgi:hypothetical protein
MPSKVKISPSRVCSHRPSATLLIQDLHNAVGPSHFIEVPVNALSFNRQFHRIEETLQIERRFCVDHVTCGQNAVVEGPGYDSPPAETVEARGDWGKG